MHNGLVCMTFAIHVDSVPILLESTSFRHSTLSLHPCFYSTSFPACTDASEGYQLCADDQQGVNPTDLFRSVDIEVKMLGGGTESRV